MPRFISPRQDRRLGRVVRRVENLLGDAGFNGIAATTTQIMVRADEDITPQFSSDCILLKGEIGAFNAVLDADGNQVTVTVWNLGEATIVDGAEFGAQWTLSEGSTGAWVAQGNSKLEPSATPRLWRAEVIEPLGIADGGTGDIRVNFQTKTGKWQHATSGKNLDVDGEIWAWGPLADGTYDIVGADCRFVSDP
jgi:hypothetical protein